MVNLMRVQIDAENLFKIKKYPVTDLNFCRALEKLFLQMIGRETNTFGRPDHSERTTFFANSYHFWGQDPITCTPQ